MPAHRHHVLSRCYLKHFAVNRKKKKDYVLHVFDRKTRKQFQTSTENVAVIREFNRIELDGQPHDVFEKALSSFESELAPALQRIVDSRSLKNIDDRALLLNFIALLALRNPRLRESIRDFHERVAKVILDFTLATPERWARHVKGATEAGFMHPDADTDYAKAKEFQEKIEFRLELATNRHIQLEMDTFDKILPLFFQRRWWLMKAPQNSGGFVTSDHPVCLMWSDPKERREMRAPGFGMRRTQVIFPISSRLAVAGAFEIEEDETEIDDWNVAAINGTITAFADRQTYSRDMHFEYVFGAGEAPRKASKLIDDRRFLQS
jgi:Protein of unknown function (DUF4238)